MSVFNFEYASIFLKKNYVHKISSRNIQGLFKTLGAYVQFVRAHFLKKAFHLLAPPKQMLFLTISNENVF